MAASSRSRPSPDELSSPLGQSGPIATRSCRYRVDTTGLSAIGRGDFELDLTFRLSPKDVRKALIIGSTCPVYWQHQRFAGDALSPPPGRPAVARSLWPR